MQKSPCPAEMRIHGAPAELWPLLDALALCRKGYGLTPSTLSVLRALISFVPKATGESTCRLIVWPSNRTLAERAGGMDERTLRRHLARLCDAGLILRNASSNGKRFALRRQQSVIAAYGFNLEPLLSQKAEILAAAEAQSEQNDAIKTIRTEILNLLFALQQEPDSQLCDADELEIRRMLRRAPDLALLVATRQHLRDKAKFKHSQTDVLSANSSQNDRLLQRTEKDTYISVCNAEKEGNHPNATDNCPETDQVTLSDCLEAVQESIAFAQSPVKTWADIVHLADTLAPMIGIGHELMHHTRRAMGPLAAAISVLCLIQPKSHIQRPAAYLRKLALLAEDGLYSLKSLVRNARKQRFAAVNQQIASC